MEGLQRILKKHGPMLSGRLGKKLADEKGIGLEAARQRLCRTRPPIRKITLGYKNNQSFVYLQEHFNTDRYWNAVKLSLKNSSKAYYALLNSCFFHSGFAKKSQLAAYGFSPVKRLTRHFHYSSIIGELQENGLISEFDNETLEINGKLFKQNNYNRFKAIEIAKTHVMQNFCDWVRNLNFGSYDTGKYLGEHAEFGKFQWGFTSPSYLNGLKRWSVKKVLPGFIVADILIGKKVDKIDVEFFLQKIGIVQQQKKGRPFIPFLICDNIEERTFKLLKSRGIAIGRVSELFGTSYAKALQLLIETIANATKIVNTNPDQFVEFCEKISTLDDKFKNMKGDLFEFVVGYFYSRDHIPLEIGKVIREPNTREPKEIDVFVKGSNMSRVVECKAYKSPLGTDEVEKWLTKNIPVIRKWILSQDDYKKKNLVFELWSTSGFGKNALKLLEKYTKSVKRHDIKYFDGSAIATKFKSTGDKKIYDLLMHYFISK